LSCRGRQGRHLVGHRVQRVEQRDETHVVFHEKIWGVRRQWEAEIVEQRPNQRIKWQSTSGPRNVGVISFHQLHDPRLTRVQVNLDFQPRGLFEKTASGFRMSRRALRSDLMRFKAFIEMRDEETGEWRGKIEEGDVVEQPGDEQPEGDDREEAEAEAHDEPEAEEGDEPEAERDEEAGDEEEGPTGRDEVPVLVDDAVDEERRDSEPEREPGWVASCTPRRPERTRRG
jgi:hypothetical protein